MTTGPLRRAFSTLDDEMNGPTLGALRQLLHFSIPEAARLLAASPERPQGVQERTWRYWESGKVPVPADIAAQVRDVLQWRSAACAAAANVLRGQLAEVGADDVIELRIYGSLEDYVATGAPAWRWRPHCSIMAELAAIDARITLTLEPSRADDAAAAARHELH